MNCPGWKFNWWDNGDEHRHYPPKSIPSLAYLEIFRTQNVDDVFCLQMGVCGHTSSSFECGIISDLIAQCHVKWQGYLKHNFAEISEGMKIAYFFSTTMSSPPSLTFQPNHWCLYSQK